MSKHIVKVGISDMNVVQEPDLIRTAGLGSCVGVVLYDDILKVAGLAHIMLPNSRHVKGSFNRAKYADTAIVDLIEMLVHSGANKKRLCAKIAGGAQMFQFTSSNDFMKIGARNIIAVEQELKEHHITLISKDVGGTNGRTIEFDPTTSQLVVRTVNKGVVEI